MTGASFLDAMRAAGLTPPDFIEPGRWHRFPGIGKANGNKDASCKLSVDGQVGWFRDWSTDLDEEWWANPDTPKTPAQRAQLAQIKEQAETEERERYAKAAREAAIIWERAKPPKNHPYLIRKNVQAYGIRQYGDALVVPVRTGGDLHSLQFIAPNGDKQFLPGGRVKGCYFAIGSLDEAEALAICEGCATGASIHETTGLPVAVAFFAGNLLEVAKAMRAKFPDVPLILAADDDWKKEKNIGVAKATEAARAVGGLVAVPDFGDDRPDDATDFNDLANLRGADAVRRAIAAARTVDVGEHQPASVSAASADPAPSNGRTTKTRDPAERHRASAPPDNTPARADHHPPEMNAPACDSGGWSDPQPMTAKTHPEPYPVDALPPLIREAVEEVRTYVKAPASLVASSALGALSVACQAHIDIRRDDKLQGPTSLYLLTIADSGERKTTCDRFFLSAIREYVQQQEEAAKPRIKDYLAAADAWQAEHDGIVAAIREASKKGKIGDKLRTDLAALEHDKPEHPRVPRLLLGDETPENLAWTLAKDWPASGVLSSEAGLILGAHSMGKDSIMRNLALLNILWDGGTHSVGRRTSESFTMKGVRLTVALQVQEATLRGFFHQSGDLARGTGFLSRFLVAWPESTQGYRTYTEPPPNWPHLAAFRQRIADILASTVPMDADGALTPATLTLTPGAKVAWIRFADAIEAELKAGGELYDVRDVAAKAADNAARLAAIFQTFEHGVGGAVGLACFESACRIVAWHLNESRRFFGELALPAELADAVRLDGWLIDYCRRKNTHFVAKNDVRQRGPLRGKAQLDAAISELAGICRLRLVKEGKQPAILLVNPALVGLTP